MSKEYKQSSIAKYILEDYVEHAEFPNNDENLKKFDLICDNGMGVKLSGYEFVDTYGSVGKHKYASYFMIKHNKDLKNFIRQPENSKYGANMEFAGDNPEIVKMAKCGLDVGIYYAVLGDIKDNTYAVLSVKQDQEDSYLFNYDFYIIGRKWKKYKKKFFEIVEHYRNLQTENRQEFISYTDGRPSKDTKFKTFDQLIFTRKQEIIKYIDNWIDKIPDYYNYGITPKLSILLYGKPGTGKSTFYKALANYLKINNVISISPSFFMDNEENGRNGGRARRSDFGRFNEYVISIDDIDCIAKSRESDDGKDNSIVTHALLTYLDNPDTFYYKAKDGVYYPVSIIVATTNYYDKLDDAVKRYGRFDLQIEMKDFKESEAREMCQIYGLQLEDIVKGKIDEKFKISPSYLQALCMENIDSKFKSVES